MSGNIPAAIGLVAAAASVSLSILLPPSPLRSAAMAISLALAGILIIGDGWDDPQIADLRMSPVKLSAAVVLGAAFIAGAATLIRRRPALLPLGILLALPFRIPLTGGGDQANLLLPLYLVIAAGVLAATLRDSEAAPPLREAWAATSWLRRLLALFAVMYILAVLYSEDFSGGVQDVGFFILPFSLAFVLLADEHWTPGLLRGALLVVVGEALIFALVGFVEYSTRELLWNDAVIRSNDFHVYFRVNSLFWDPNVYGRFLAIVLVTVTTALLWSRDRRTSAALVVMVALLMAALTTTFSQSSLAALLGGLAVLAALRWSARLTVGIGAAAAILVIAAGFATGVLDRPNIDTGGRANLVTGGLGLYGDRPVAGYGSGSFPLAYREHANEGKAPVVESHTEPVTVAAEQGTIGLLVYLGLLGVALLTLTRGMGRTMPGLARRDGFFALSATKSSSSGPDPGPSAASEGGTELVARAAISAAFVALLIHTMAYAGFVEDPLTWCLLAIGGSLAPSSSRG